MKEIKVVQYGIGPIGIKIIQNLSQRKNIKITGAIDIDSSKIGKDIGIISELEYETGVKISNDSKNILKNSSADVVVLTTSSSIEKIKPQLMEIISYGINIVSTCEELTFPWITNHELSKEIDEAAKANNVSVLSTGVNPGFLMDFLPSALTSMCNCVEKIEVDRIQNAEFRRIPFQNKIGAGLSLEEFKVKEKTGSLRHVGLTESIHFIASKLGWTLDKTEDIIEPVIAEEDFNKNQISIKKGNILGVRQTGKGFKNNNEVIILNFVASIGQPFPEDKITIKGIPDIEMRIKDGINGDIATCAITANAVQYIINAKPGLRTMADIEPISCLR